MGYESRVATLSSQRKKKGNEPLSGWCQFRFLDECINPAAAFSPPDRSPAWN
jgi:hypothetical protein